MQQIVVKSSSQINDVISKLTSYNKQFDQRVQELISEHSKVDAMWDGQANDAFKQEFNKDKVQFNNFHQAIEEYIRALKTILTNYENAETTNTNIAKSRR